MPIPPPSPVETFASFIRGLTGGVAATSGMDRLSCLLIGLIVTLLRDIKCGLARLAARSAAGTYAPAPLRHSATPALRRPRQPSKLPRTVGWMLRLDPPDILARPAKSRPPRKPSPAAPKAEPPRPGPPLPEWVRERRKPWSLARIRGSPRSA